MFLLLPEAKSYTLPELQARLKFKYAPQITFATKEAKEEIATKEAKEEIRSLGIEKYKRQMVTAQEIALGERYHRHIQEAYIADVSIHYLNEEIGFGLFAQEDIPPGHYVGEYTGRVRRNDRRYFEPLNNYCYRYPVPDEIGRDFVTDATEGNLTRFINHSNAPNLQPLHAFYEGFYHLIFLSIDLIKKGTQLTYDYGQNYWLIRSPPQNLE